MAVETIDIVVPANAWTKVTSADGEYHFSSPDPFLYVYATTLPPDTLVGHFSEAGELGHTALIDLGRFLYVKARYAPITLALTKSW